MDMINTDIFSQYTYTTPISGYIPSGLDIIMASITYENVIDPYDYFYNLYLQYQNISSIFYWDWEYLFIPKFR